jgi:hypothetical protein
VVVVVVDVVMVVAVVVIVDVVVVVVDVVVVVLDGGVALTLYRLSRLGPPQYSELFPLHGMEQPLVAGEPPL